MRTKPPAVGEEMAEARKGHVGGSYDLTLGRRLGENSLPSDGRFCRIAIVFDRDVWGGELNRCDVDVVAPGRAICELIPIKLEPARGG